MTYFSLERRKYKKDKGASPIAIESNLNSTIFQL